MTKAEHIRISMRKTWGCIRTLPVGPVRDRRQLSISSNPHNFGERGADMTTSEVWTTSASEAGLCSTHFFGLTRLWLIWQSRWLNSDSTQIPNSLTWLNSDWTKKPHLLTWLNSDSTHLSQSWVKSDSRLITFYLIWEKVVDGGGGAVECSCRLVLSL